MALADYEVRERMALITLNRPEKRNALSPVLVSELKKLFQRAADDASVRVVILRAEGDAFCAGADLTYLEKMQHFTYEENLSDSLHLKELLYQIYTLPKPVIAQVQGPAIAGGTGLVSVCDFAFAAPTAKFGYTEVKIGFVPALVMVFLLQKLAPGKARDLLLTGRLFLAEEAAQLGLITKVAEPQVLSETVESFAKKLMAETSGQSVALVKRLLHVMPGMSIESALDEAARANAGARSSSDYKKGIGSFLHKTPVEW